MAGYVTRGIVSGALVRTRLLNIAVSSVTARAGGGKAQATPITTASGRIATVAAAPDSVLIPSPRVGDRMELLNAGANAAQVFAAGTATINGAATGTGVSLAAGKLAILTCYAGVDWTLTVLN